MKIGVLTIGSLYWDPNPVREQWRRERLVQNVQQRVKVPIHYGRQSDSRGCSYTMVFSTDLDKEKFGRAIVMPCRTRATGIEDIIGEAKHLWAAESFDKEPGSISASWGCVALLRNPANRIPQGIHDGWIKHVSNEERYGNVAVDECGFLKISWPDPADGPDLDFDLLLATSTKPTIKKGEYPSSADIAGAWTTAKGKEHIDYFLKITAHGITTSQDEDIEDCLKQKGCY